LHGFTHNLRQLTNHFLPSGRRVERDQNIESMILFIRSSKSAGSLSLSFIYC
jgi:hypothetical protein